MNDQAENPTRSAWRLRWSARAPRIAFFAVAAILALSGLRTVIAGPPEAPAAPRPVATSDLGAASFAEAFARAYLSWDPARPEVHERVVARFASDELEPGAGISSVRRAQRVLWSAAVGEESHDRRRLVTVAVQTDAQLLHLAVPVMRDRRGFLLVSGYPAVVGAPAANVRAELPSERDVEDEQLRTVAERALRNYLGAERPNLLADLDPAAVVSLPETPLRVESVDELTWAGRDRVAAEVRARAQGAALTLRYELAVVRRERWYVRAIQTDPRQTNQGGPK